jgi:hypothetical protein
VSKRRRIALYAAAGVVVWFVVLLVLGPIYAGHTRDRVAERIGDSLQASVTIGEPDLGLVRGVLTLEQLAARRDDEVGHLALDVASVRCDLLPLGLALIDRDCRELSVRGTRLEVSSAALFRLKRPKRPPFRAAHVVIDDAHFVWRGTIDIAIAHAEAGPTVFKTPLSWLFALRALDASVQLPAGIAIHLEYVAGRLRASGSMFGSRAVSVPVALPVANALDDAKAEIYSLVAFGKHLAEQLVMQRVADWLDATLR